MHVSISPFDVVAALGYLAAAAAAFMNRTASDQDTSTGDGIYWSASVMVLLGLVLARLGVARGAADRVRSIARDQGWYQDRSGLQFVGLVLITVLCVALFVAISTHVSKPLRWHLAATVGLIALGTSRAVSLHDVDHVLETGTVGALSVADLIELGFLCATIVLARPRWLRAIR